MRNRPFTTVSQFDFRYISLTTNTKRFLQLSELRSGLSKERSKGRRRTTPRETGPEVCSAAIVHPPYRKRSPPPQDGINALSPVFCSYGQVPSAGWESRAISLYSALMAEYPPWRGFSKAITNKGLYPTWVGIIPLCPSFESIR